MPFDLATRLAERQAADLFRLRPLLDSPQGPQVRVAALVGLGRGFRAKKIYDLAVMQFKSAKTDLTAMDDTKKEVIYELGSCYEAMGKPEEAIAEFKAIYGEDIGYRDVADKITAFYSK